jgi:hypothetical protein
MALVRVTGWEEILAAKVADARGRVFAWGDFDCCRFAAECIEVVTGVDHLQALAAKYHDEASALAYIEASGGLRAAVSTFLGEPIDGWARARRGDICLVPTVRGEGVGVCVGGAIAVADDIGVGLYRLDRALAVWAID